MASPRSRPLVRRPSLPTVEDNSLPWLARRNTLTSLIRSRSNQSLVSAYRPLLLNGPEDAETGGMHGAGPHDEDDIGRLLQDERRLSKILCGPQMRSQNLIGKSNPRYNWHRYWKQEDELDAMPKPVRKYYQRTNELIQQYMYIDCLLDSAIPHELLNEYSAELDSSAFRLQGVPETIREETGQSTPSPPTGRSDGSASPYGSTSPTNQVNAADQPDGAQRTHRTPKDIFRSSETMPLLQRDDEDNEAEMSSVDESGPKPYLPWLDEAEIDSDDPIVTVAIWVNMVANIILLTGKIIVVASVPSMSVLASLVDAVLDFLSTAIVYATTKLISAGQKDQFTYPVGRRRLEPVGVLVFSVIMVTCFVQVALQSIQRLGGPDHEILELGIPAITIMVGTIVIKGACWLWCRVVRNSSVRALADDAKTDVIFNVGSILFPIGKSASLSTLFRALAYTVSVGYYGRIWWLDALGGLLLSLVVIFNWSQTSAHHVRNLTGFSAQPDERNLLLYLTMRFAAAIRKIQNLRAYHAGDKLFVEADIVLSPDMPLKDSHDLSEVLTYFLESVPIVERAFVHVDYTSYNAPTHMTKQARAS